MIDIKKVLEYNQYLRHKYFEALSELPWEEVIRDRGASFGSLRDIYLHCIVVIEYILHILQGDTSYQRINYDDYDNIEKIGEYLESAESKLNMYLSKIDLDGLSRRIQREQRNGSTIVSTVEDYLFHLFQEETHHMGEFIALLWQMDIRPPHIGWTEYLNLKS